MSDPITKYDLPATMIQIAIAVAASVLLVASFVTFEPAPNPGTVRLSTGEKAAPVTIGAAGANLPVLPAPSALTSETGGTRLQGSGQPPPPASAYTHMMFSSGV